MKKYQERALNAFAALESLPDGMLLEAEQALIAAEGGVITPVKTQTCRLRTDAYTFPCIEKPSSPF